MDSLADDSIQPDVTDDEKHQKAAANIKEVSNSSFFAKFLKKMSAHPKIRQMAAVSLMNNKGMSLLPKRLLQHYEKRLTK